MMGVGFEKKTVLYSFREVKCHQSHSRIGCKNCVNRLDIVLAGSQSRGLLSIPLGGEKCFCKN